MNRYNVAFFLGIVFLCSCSQAPKEGKDVANIDSTAEKIPSYIKDINKQVMDLHNETMKKMDSLMMLKMELKKQLGLTKEPDLKDSIKAAIDKIQNANNTMMDWMHDYHAPDVKTNKDSAIAYMNLQLIKIQVVQTKIRKSLDHANNTLKGLAAKK